MKIGNRVLGNGAPCFIIAELSANHGQDLGIALKTLEAAKEAGADAIKLQTYTADTMTLDSKKEYFKINQGTIWDGRYLHELYQEAYTPWEWHKPLFEKAQELGLICFSSPFDTTAVDLLENLDAPAHKIASFEITDIPLIKKVAKTGKPIIISTGIATLEDITLAIDTCKGLGNNDIVILKCTSSYPAPIDMANLRTMVDIKEKFDVLVGLSDHTFGTTVPVTATAMGAVLIEKHFILDKSLGGPDASFSLDPTDFKEMVDAVRNSEKAMGKVTYDLNEKTINSRGFSRSLFAVEDIAKGEELTPSNVRTIRPNNGLHPKHYNEVLGKKAVQDIERGTPLSFDLLT